MRFFEIYDFFNENAQKNNDEFDEAYINSLMPKDLIFEGFAVFQKNKELVRKIILKLEEYDKKHPLSVHQKIIHRKMVSYVCPHVFGSSFVEFKERVFKEFDLPNTVGSGLLVTAPRQFGKSTTIAVFSVVLMLVVPRYSAIVLSQTQKISGKDVGMGSKIEAVLGVFGEKGIKVTNNKVKNGLNGASISFLSALSGEG